MRLFIVGLTLGILALSQPAVIVAQEYEQAPILSAKEMLPKKLLKTDYYSIDERVVNDGYLNIYQIRSSYGDDTAVGRAVLDIKLNELRALHDLNDYSSSKVVYEAAKKNGKQALLAPVHVAEALVDVVTNPMKVVDTAKSIPDGVLSMFSWASKQVGKGIDAAQSYMSSDSSSEGSGQQSSKEGLASKGVGAATNAGLNYIHYNSAERELLQKLSIDQFSDNVLLQKEVQRVAGIETAVSIAFKFVPGFNLGLIGSAARWYKRAEELGLYKEPEEIVDMNRKRLLELGVEKEAANKFINNGAMRPSLQALILDNLLKLKGVHNRQGFVILATQAKKLEVALFFASASEMLSELHQETPFERLVVSLHLPGAITAAGHVVVPLPVDYLPWTKDISGIFHDYKKVVASEHKVKSGEVVTTGRSSPMAKRELGKLGVVVVEYKKR